MLNGDEVSNCATKIKQVLWFTNFVKHFVSSPHLNNFNEHKPSCLILLVIQSAIGS